MFGEVYLELESLDVSVSRAWDFEFHGFELLKVLRLRFDIS